jgi:hypothetical protein
MGLEEAKAESADSCFRYQDDENISDLFHLLFVCIAAVFSFLVLFQDLLGIVRFRSWLCENARFGMMISNWFEVLYEVVCSGCGLGPGDAIS